MNRRVNLTFLCGCCCICFIFLSHGSQAFVPPALGLKARPTGRSSQPHHRGRGTLGSSKVGRTFAIRDSDEDGGGGVGGGGPPPGIPRDLTAKLERTEEDGDVEEDVEQGGLGQRLSNWLSNDAVDDLKLYGTSLVVALLFRTFICEPRFIPSLSMYPTFEVGDQLAVEKVTKRYQHFHRRDVVVFSPPDAFYDFSSRQKGEALIKRVVAVAGDVVRVQDGTLFINGEAQEEQYALEKAEYDMADVRVPEGMVLVLGDNRNHSLDGHIWGFLPEENVIGKAIFKYWPIWRVGPVEDA